LVEVFYAYAGLPDDPWKLLQGWVRMLPPEAVFAGVTAAWLHGLDFDPIHPIEVNVPPDSQARSRAGLTVRHRCIIEAAVVRGLRVSTVHRTLSDLSLRLSAVETLIALDAALKSGLVDRASLLAWTRLVRLGELAMPAESPMETRLRGCCSKPACRYPKCRPTCMTRRVDSSAEPTFVHFAQSGAINRAICLRIAQNGVNKS